jgi:hypothetical protein
MSPLLLLSSSPVLESETMGTVLKRTSRDFTAEQLDLRPGDRVIVRFSDGTEERRVVSSPPMRLKLHDGLRWVVWLEGTDGWFALWRVRPAGRQ